MQYVAIHWPLPLPKRAGIGYVWSRAVCRSAMLAGGGVVADAVDRKRLMFVTQTVMMVSACALAAVTWFGLRSVWPIYVLTALAAAATAFDNPARQALMPMLVPAEEFPNAVSLWMIVFHLSTVIGPALAGLLLGLYSPGLVYAVNTVSFLAVIFALLLMRVRGRVVDAEREASRVSFEALKEGLRFVWRTPIIVQTMTLDFVATFFASATALLPIFAAEILHVGARGLGMLAAAPAAGSVLTAFVMARLGTLRRQGAIVIAAVAVYGAATIAFGLSRVFWFSLLMLAVTGAADTVSTVLRQTLRQLVTRTTCAVRMPSVHMVFFLWWPATGRVEAGAVAALIGAPLLGRDGAASAVPGVALSMLMAKSPLNYESGKALASSQ